MLIVAPSPPPYGGMALQARQLERRLTSDGVPVDYFSSNFPLPGVLSSFERAPVLRTAIRAVAIWFLLLRRLQRASIVHLFAASWVYFFVVVYPTVILGRVCRKRVVVNYRGGEAREFFGRYGWLAKPVFRLASVVTAPSEFLAGVIRRHFGVPVAIVPNLLDTSIFRYRERRVFRPKLLVTRHLEPMYDIEAVMRAYRAVQEDFPGATLWIAGSGSAEEHLRRLAADWALPGVRFLGQVPHSQLPELYNACDIYVNASRVDNFPGALVEASAAGLAVVTTAAGGIPYLYEHEKTALLVPPGDWQGLAGSVKNVLLAQAQAIAMTEAALKMVRACDWVELRERLYGVYGFAFTPVRADASSEGTKCAAG